MGIALLRVVVKEIVNNCCVCCVLLKQTAGGRGGEYRYWKIKSQMESPIIKKYFFIFEFGEGQTRISFSNKEFTVKNIVDLVALKKNKNKCKMLE